MPLLGRSAPFRGLVTFRQTFARRCHGRKKPQPLTGRGKLAERIEVEFGPYRPAASRRAECLLVALPTSRDLLLCAKDLLVEANRRLRAKPALVPRDRIVGGLRDHNG
jgi:hypothetical protein